MKFFKCFFIFLCFLIMCDEINAEVEENPTCDMYYVGYKKSIENEEEIDVNDTTIKDEDVLTEEDLVHNYQEYVSLLHDTGWNTYAYQCQIEGGSCTTESTACEFDSATVATWQCYRTETRPYQKNFGGMKGYSMIGTAYENIKVPVPCKEPPAILCSLICDLSKCDSSDTCGGYCDGGGGSKKEDCPSSWVAPYLCNLKKGTAKCEKGGGKGDTVTESDCDALKTAKNCDVMTCEKKYRSEYTTCTMGQCNRKPLLVEGTHDFVYALYKDFNQFTTDPVVTYCANPSLNPLLGGEEFHYANAVDIDIMNCADSNSSVDCGVANIMSEAYYRNKMISEQSGKYNIHVVSLAIRMWYAYHEFKGFDTMGIAEEDRNTIKYADKFLAFIPGEDGKFPNVYKNTLDGIRRNLFFDEFIDVTEDYNFMGADIGNLKGIACSKNNPGVYCNGYSGSTTYTYAAYLFINTVQGNPYMKEHFMASLGGFEVDLQDEELIKEISKKYDEPLNYQISLSNDGKVATINYELREFVNKSCTDADVECDTTEQTLKIFNANGDEIVVTIDNYDYCNKNICTAVIEFDEPIQCINIVSTTITYTGKKTCGSTSIRKYISCSADVNDQIMYSFEPDDCKNDVDDTITINGIVDCPGGCEEEPPVTGIANCKLDTNGDDIADTYLEGSGYYYDPSIEKEKQVGVKYEVTNDYFKQTISDPSLNCILHKKSSAASYYDYSSYFGLANNKFCKVYCSDSVEYYLPPRKEVKNALQIRYDVQPGETYGDKNSALFTSIKTKRNCVSKIFYDDFEFNSSYNKWSEGYGLDPILKINNWSELYDAVYNLSLSQGKKKDYLHSLIYDLYNCNFFSDDYIVNDAKVIKPENYADSAHTYAVNYLNKANEYCGKKDNNGDTNTNKCISGQTTFQGGAEYIQSTGIDDRVGGNYKNYGHPDLLGSSNVSDSVSIKYCEASNGCFVVNPDAEKPYEDNFDDPNIWKTNSSMVSNSKYPTKNNKIPSNDYVVFSYELDGYIYNETEYQAEPLSGKVQPYKDSDKTKYNKIAKDTLPLSYASDALCENNTCKIRVNVYNNIYYEYNKNINKYVEADSNDINEINGKNAQDGIGPNAFFRKNTSDSFITAVNSLVSEGYMCDFTIPSTKLDFTFRNINLSAPVPSSDGTRKNNAFFKNSNWDLSNEVDSEYIIHLGNVIKQIKNSSDDLYGRDKYLQYSFVLDDNSIRKIRDYNDNNSDYSSIVNSIDGSLTLSSCDKSEGKYFNCESSFVQGISTMGVKVIKGDGISLFDDCKANPTKEGCDDL